MKTSKRLWKKRDGVDQVIDRVSQLLNEVEDVELVSQEELYRPELDVDEDGGLKVKVDENGIYVVTGRELRRIMYSVNFDDMESLQFFQAQMEAKGVFDMLREAGIEDGDTVKIYELEFDVCRSLGQTRLEFKKEDAKC